MAIPMFWTSRCSERRRSGRRNRTCMLSFKALALWVEIWVPAGPSRQHSSVRNIDINRENIRNEHRSDEWSASGCNQANSKSNIFNKVGNFVERVTGIEPAPSAWESDRSRPIRPAEQPTSGTVSSRECPLMTLVNCTLIARRPSVFQAEHIPSWRGSCECYALSSVAAARRWLLLLLSPLLSAAGPAPWRRAAPCPAQAPPPNPTAAEPDGRRVLSRGGAADHEAKPRS